MISTVGSSGAAAATAFTDEGPETTTWFRATAVRVANGFAGTDLPESDELVRETVCELANQVIGNAVTTLNDQGFHFRVHPPLLLTAQEGDKTNEDTEALMICFETSLGDVYMNVALRYNKRRSADHAALGA